MTQCFNQKQFFLHFKFDDFSMGYKSKPDKHSDLQKILAM